MPLYTYKCSVCGYERTDLRTIDERGEGPFCYGDVTNQDHEPTMMDLQITPVAGFVKNPAVRRG